MVRPVCEGTVSGNRSSRISLTDPVPHASADEVFGKDKAKRIVICGGGAIGVAIAYFLSRRGGQPIVIERHTVAGAASGKSGGFVARDWAPVPLGEIGRGDVL